MVNQSFGLIRRMDNRGDKMKLEPIKDFTAIVSVEWCTTFEANNKEDFIEKLKGQYKEDYNIELVDDEIKIVEEK